MRHALPYASIPAAMMGLVCLALPALAQPVPERVEIGNGNMTVGFELKTTTHGDGPEGRTSAHSLLKEVIIPKPGYNWTGEAATEVSTIGTPHCSAGSESPRCRAGWWSSASARAACRCSGR